MTPEVRNWLTKWTLQGRPQVLLWEMFVEMPEEVFEHLPDAEETGTVLVLSPGRVRKIETGYFPALRLYQIVDDLGIHYVVDVTPPTAGLSFKKCACFVDAITMAMQMVQQMEASGALDVRWQRWPW